jgi:hypothetical protein
MKVLRAIGHFVWDFIVGDDWKVAASVLAVLGLAALVLVAGGGAGWVIAVVALGLPAAFSLALIVDVRRR